MRTRLRAGARRASSARASGCAGSVPDVLERAEPQLGLVVERAVVDVPHVLVPPLLDERLVRLARLPAVDHEVPAGRLDVPEQLRADVAAAGPEERAPLAVGPVRPLELRCVAGLVREDERQHRPDVSLAADERDADAGKAAGGPYPC